MMTSKDAVRFLNQQPALSHNKLEKEASLPAGYLHRAVKQGKHSLLDKHLEKLEPVLKRYGYVPAEGAHVIAVANNKGGVGKTTTTTNLGKALHLMGYRVLLVDMDPQGNLSEGLGFFRKKVGTEFPGGFVKTRIVSYEPDAELQARLSPQLEEARKVQDEMLVAELEEQLHPQEKEILDESNHELVDCLVEKAGADFHQVIMEVEDGFDIAPTHINMDMAFKHLDSIGFRGYKRLREVLSSVRTNYDFILIDTPPSLGMLTSASMVAANSVLVTMMPEPFATAGLDNLMGSIKELKDINPGLQIEGLVFTRYESVILHKDTIHEVASIEHFRIFETIIRKNILLSEAIKQETDVFTYDSNANGALDYKNLALEICGERSNSKLMVSKVVSEMENYYAKA